jgi:hypothetical protein
MATAGGHWNNLAEAAKLTQATLLPGVVETDIKLNNPIEFCPVVQAAKTGSSIAWVKEKTTTEDYVTTTSIGGETVWTENVTYDTGSTTLEITYIQRLLDTYVEQVYGNINNYRAQMLKEAIKGCMRKMGHRFFYGDNGVDAEEWDGVHALIAAEGAVDTSTGLNIDAETGALSLYDLRVVIDEMRHGCDAIFMPRCIKRRMDQAYFERGMYEAVENGYTNQMSVITQTVDTAGRRMTMFDGIPIIPTDYLTAETDGSGVAQDGQRISNTAAASYSVVLVKWGTNAGLDSQDPGLKFAFGHPTRDLDLGEFFTLEYFDKLETHIAQGFRIYNFGTLVAPSKYALGRIVDVTDAAVTV